MTPSLQVVVMVKATFIDGITFDYESPIANGAPEAEWYVQIINETTAGDLCPNAHPGLPAWPA